MLTMLVQHALHAACWFSARKFFQQRDNLEQVQRQKLTQLLKLINSQQTHSINSWEEFRTTFPVTRYADWQEKIEQQRLGTSNLVNSPLVRYQPTSGSSEKLKLIPYTQQFLSELDAAISPWLASMFKRHPAMKKGVHYWSVSWLPKNQFDDFKGNLNDDSELLGGAKRLITSYSQAVSSEVALAANPADSLFATLCYLVARKNLTVLSVWSPTFALQLLELLPQYAQDIATVLEQGQWGPRSESLQKLKAPKTKKRAVLLKQLASADIPTMAQTLWPDLALISAWDTADAAQWAQQLQQLLPHTAFEGKGLWATEGVVTIPVDGQYPLAYRSHVYEFELISSGEILAPWELKLGDEVSPIISGGNGLLRYAMDDHLKVSGFWGQIPCFTFMGRRNGVDLVGEKMSPNAARQVLKTLADEFGLEGVSLLALSSNKNGHSQYMGLFSGKQPISSETANQLNIALEQVLQGHFHYALARDLQQLLPAQAIVVEDGWKFYQELAMAAGMIEGNIKPEALRKMAKDVFLKFTDNKTEAA